MRYWKMGKRALAVTLAAALLNLGGLSDAAAMLAPAQVESPARQADVEKVQSFLHHKVVQQRLMDYGLTESQAHERVQRLTDQELRQAAMQIDQQNPGGDSVAGVLVIAILVLLIVYLVKRV